MPHVLWLFICPFAAALLLFIIPLPSRSLKKIALALSLIPLALLLYGSKGWLAAEFEVPWFPALGIEFYLNIDSLSLLFLFLTAVIIPITVAAASETLTSPNAFYGLILTLEGLLIGFFMARDLVLFTILFEAMLIPLYFIISIWGGHDRRNAALKFLIYMIAGSCLLIAAVLALYIFGGETFNLDNLSKTASASPYAYWIFAAFVLAFAVKTPLFPFHAWLPEAYYQASLPGTILLSALLSKAGIYGFLRIVLELFPEHLKAASPYLLTLAIIGVFYAGFIAWVEKDYKKLIAYSSLSHVNFILAGIFVWSPPAQAGAILQAINHGITITGLFLAAGWLEQRLGTTTIKVSGLAKFLPYLCWLTMIFVLSAIALPGTNSFIGEFMVLLGLFKENPWAAAVLTLSVILSVMYMLRWMQRVYFGEPSFFQERWVDLKFKEALIALPLVLLILWIGIYPAPVLNQIKAAMGQYAQLEKKS